MLSRFAQAPAAAGSAGRALVLGLSAVLLLSFGGAIVAAPLALPLLAWTARATPSHRLRIVAALLAGLTAAEVGWAAVYLTLGESQPWIVAIPLVAGLGAATALVRRR
ncbi:MAG: hypothetical protein QOE93_2445 [Actinomycetota bacterium]|nr:hypothetical protein [Actinomycetota bacterium]